MAPKIYKGDLFRNLTNIFKQIGYRIYIFILAWWVLYILFLRLNARIYYFLSAFLGGWGGIIRLAAAAVTIYSFSDWFCRKNVKIIIENDCLSVIKPFRKINKYSLNNADFFMRAPGAMFCVPGIDYEYTLQVLNAEGYMEDIKCYGFDKSTCFLLLKELEGWGRQKKVTVGSNEGWF